MQPLRSKSGKTRFIAPLAATLAIFAFSASALADGIAQSGEQKNMRLVGHVGLQGRGAYQPNVIAYPDGRTIAFAGLHNAPNLNNSPGPLPNPLNNGALEFNGTMIIDVTDPKHPFETAHIPVNFATAQAQMARMCLGSDLPGGKAGKVYLLRNIQGSSDAGYEVYDVTDVTKPMLLSFVRNLRSTHKDWWECKTGIAYMPGSKNASPLWRESQSMLIMDWSNPYAPPKYIRTYGLPGTQPGSTGPVPPALHGAISAYEHPNAAGKLVNGATANDVIGNRIYAAWGIGSDGVLQILDRKKLLPPAYGGTYTGDPDTPTEADLLSAQVGRMDMSPDQGGHTSMPVFGIRAKSLQTVPDVRDIVLLASEAGDCTSQHWSFIVDVSTENSIGVRQNPWQGPMVLSTLWVNPHSGEKFPRGNYCSRGQRFGVHSSEENFRNPYYGKVTFTSYFNAGVRAWDIRDPQAPVEVAFYVPAAPNNTYMTNNVEVDNRGYIYIVDRIGNGMDILKLTGDAREIASPGSGDDD
jgi:hypothetical protein